MKLTSRFRPPAIAALACSCLLMSSLLAAQVQAPIQLTPSSRPSAANPNGANAAIQAVLDAQRTAWNNHDLDGFMAGYWNSPDLTFFGSKETSGWQATLARYRETYQSAGKAMGKLDFSDLRIEVLCPEAAFVRGTWRLVMPDGKQPHGLFTLVFRKFPEGWRIIHDHTSSTPD